MFDGSKSKIQILEVPQFMEGGRTLLIIYRVPELGTRDNCCDNLKLFLTVLLIRIRLDFFPGSGSKIIE